MLLSLIDVACTLVYNAQLCCEAKAVQTNKPLPRTYLRLLHLPTSFELTCAHISDA